MALFDNAEEKERRQKLAHLEEKRMAFAERMHASGYRSDRSLYAQREGGFTGLVQSGEQLLYVTGPGPNDEALDFTVRVVPSVPCHIEPVLIKGEGAGGFLGFGKKGGAGFRMELAFPEGEPGVLEIVSGFHCYFENERGRDPLFDLKRRRYDANFVWDFKPVERTDLQAVMTRWKARLGQGLG